MCMGLGCNAVGVMGCRIIQSPRERLLAILTNALMPCNGRFPTLMTLTGVFLFFAGGAWSAAEPTDGERIGELEALVAQLLFGGEGE